jgi:hypothetical protein
MKWRAATGAPEPVAPAATPVPEVRSQDELSEVTVDSLERPAEEPAPAKDYAEAGEKPEAETFEDHAAAAAQARPQTAPVDQAANLAQRVEVSPDEVRRPSAALSDRQAVGGQAQPQLGAGEAREPLPAEQIELARRVLDAKQANENAQIVGAEVEPLVITLHFVPPGPVPEPAASALFRTYEANLDGADRMDALREQLRVEVERQAGELPEASPPATNGAQE